MLRMSHTQLTVPGRAQMQCVLIIHGAVHPKYYVLVCPQTQNCRMGRDLGGAPGDREPIESLIGSTGAVSGEIEKRGARASLSGCMPKGRRVHRLHAARRTHRPAPGAAAVLGPSFVVIESHWSCVTRWLYSSLI